jgi:TnpA family transposase
LRLEPQYEAQTNQAICLNVVTNAVIIWNTVYMQAALDQPDSIGFRGKNSIH